jgi:two-component system OmpR family sensor kinase/two-component system sensor histidine kinase BaeS
MSEQPSSDQQNEWRQGMRFLPILLSIFAILLLFIGGIAALLYWLFTEYTSFRSVWVLVCCLPVGVVALALMAIFSLYTRYGRPLGQIFSAIDSVSEGDLSVRVPDDSSPQFGELIKRFNKMVVELERADRQRRDLTADIAHELRTPLHIIQGKLEGIQDGVYAATSEHIGDALDETRLLARLVEDLQTLSLAESGQLPLHKSRFLLADLLQDTAASFAAQAAAAGIQLHTEVSQPGLQLTADHLRLSQVLANLVSNALRYTPQGGSILLAAEPAGDGRARLRVRDTGRGIPAEDLPFIFDRFWRGDKSRTREGHANSGLGLAISRQLILAHGGSIEAHSQPGLGAEFIIELPES